MDNIPENTMIVLENYLKKVLEVNKSLNLTRVTEESEAKLLHLEDSLHILKEVNEAPAGNLLDFGSGGGFPGVPLGIATNRKTILIDSVKKKMDAVASILNDLDIQNIETSGERIEEYTNDHRNQFSVITARAVTSTAALLELAAPLLIQGGHLILMKSQIEDKYDEEIAEQKLGMKLKSFREYYLSDGETYRNVYVFEKKNEPSICLPRRTGMAQKRPVAGVS